MTESRYFNRELSWLEFNQRVLDEALDPSIPLLERLKFLAITASNLDEFFMVRVGGLQSLDRQDPSKTDPAGMTAGAQLAAISERSHRMLSDQSRCYLEQLEPKLSQAGIRRLRPGEMSEPQARFLETVFEDEIRAVLTPMAVTAEAFPLLTNQALTMAVRLEDQDDAPRFAVIPLGRSLSRFITLDSVGGYEFLLLEDAVQFFAQRFFPGEALVECVPFRITRNADMSVREDQAADLLTGMGEVLDARKHSACVRLEIDSSASAETRQFLQETLEIASDDVYSTESPLDLADFMRLTDLKGFEKLQYRPWPPQPSPEIDLSQSLFETLSQKDVLLYHPYDQFEPVVKFVEEAADDPDVLAIKQTLYRTSSDSPIVAALARAAQNGKSVAVLVELKARFDEARNIEWAGNLEREGVQVIYGVRGLKTHSKICLIVRREPHGIQRYVHFGTGNYNEKTARLYTDASYMTSDDDLSIDAVNFFNAITGYSQPMPFRKIDAAPIGLREKLVEMIEAQTSRQQQGQNTLIMAKLNALVDPAIIDALYEASQAGVEIKLNIRGICCLRPGVAGLSENITVVSVIDRFLEHARIICFRHGRSERVFISSADWMPRNLVRRVELMVPVDDSAAKRRLISILELPFLDTVKGRRLLGEGGYKRLTLPDGRKGKRSQEYLYQLARDAVTRMEQTQPTAFETHRAPDAV